jgi:hypothetical protein
VQLDQTQASTEQQTPESHHVYLTPVQEALMASGMILAVVGVAWYNVKLDENRKRR